MSAPDIAQWLRSLGLGRYEQAFRDNDIDGEVLADLDDADLEKLGVSLGHRKKLLKAIAALAGPAAALPPRPALLPEIEGERRQVTVLFADLAGYTRLTRELGAEAMHDITDRFFGLADGLIERFGGTHRQAYRRLRDGGVRRAGGAWQRSGAGGARGARDPRRDAGSEPRARLRR